MGTAQVVRDDDEDITQHIAGVGTVAAPATVAAPQAEVSSPTSPAPAEAAFINTDQVTVLLDRFKPWEDKALKEFLRIAKREALAGIRAEEFDGALEWCDRNLNDKRFKKAA